MEDEKRSYRVAAFRNINGVYRRLMLTPEMSYKKAKEYSIFWDFPTLIIRTKREPN